MGGVMRLITAVFGFFILLGLPEAYAARIEIQTPSQVRVGDILKLQVTYIDENDSYNVGHLSSYQAGQGLRHRGGGNFDVYPSYNGRDYQTSIQVSYFKTSGQVFTKTVNLWVDSTPDRLVIRGPFSVRVNSISNFRAEACFNFYSHCIDVTNEGRWYAWQGRMGPWGTYYAPSIASYAMIDFSYGSLRETYRLYVNY